MMGKERIKPRSGGRMLRGAPDAGFVDDAEQSRKESGRRRVGVETGEKGKIDHFTHHHH